MISEMELKINEADIKPRQCYFNVFYICMGNKSLLEKNDCRVAIGYVNYKDNPSLYYRHCYIVSNDGDLIYDAADKYLTRKGMEYRNSKLFEVDEYINMVLKCMDDCENDYVKLDKVQELTAEGDLKIVEEFYGVRIPYLTGQNLLIKK